MVCHFRLLPQLSCVHPQQGLRIDVSDGGSGFSLCLKQFDLSEDSHCSAVHTGPRATKHYTIMYLGPILCSSIALMNVNICSRGLHYLG